MKKEKLLKVLELTSSDTVEGALDEVLDVYLKSKLADTDEETLMHYRMVWGPKKECKAEGVSTDGKHIRILAGSDYNMKESESLGQSYRNVRDDLQESGVVLESDDEEEKYEIGYFDVDHEFLSFSTAASVIRGFQTSGPQAFKPKKPQNR